MESTHCIPFLLGHRASFRERTGGDWSKNKQKENGVAVNQEILAAISKGYNWCGSVISHFSKG